MYLIADFLEARNALLFSLRDHDELLRKKRRQPGEDRETIVDMLIDMGCDPWEYGEEPWIR